VPSDGKILVLGSGGVSLFAAQFARALGLHVVGTTSSAEKTERLRALGVEQVVNYKEHPEWGEAVHQACGGVHKVVDVSGAGTLNQSLTAVLPAGEVALIGFLSPGGEAPNPMLLQGKGANIRGIAVGSVAMQRAMCAFIDEHALKPVLWRTFEVGQLAEAYQAQQSPDMFGKIVITL
jgi:NADPH:quinone reductase-like Zn-dependent oxidoreductase